MSLFSQFASLFAAIVRPDRSAYTTVIYPIRERLSSCTTDSVFVMNARATNLRIPHGEWKRASRLTITLLCRATHADSG